MAAKGKLIAFEGVDGTGKSTQIQALSKLFEDAGQPVYIRREPTTDGEWGKILRKSAIEGRLPVEDEAEHFLKDRQWNAEVHTLPAMERGEWVFLDRYYLSSMAYQGSRGLDPEEIMIRNEKISPRPDLVFMFDLPLEESLSRIQSNRSGGQDTFEEDEQLKKVKLIFDGMDWPEIERIDASQSREVMTKQLWKILEKRFPDSIIFQNQSTARKS